MFKNRALQVKMVKNDKEETPKINYTRPTMPLAVVAKTISDHVQSTVKTVGKTVLLYVAADTIRQVMVEHAKK